jgi:Integrase core domain
MAESFVDSFKTELIADRVWRSRSQLELAVVEYVAWFNTTRLHSALGYRTPDEVEAEWRAASQPITPTEADAQLTLTATDREYEPSGLDSALRC